MLRGARTPLAQAEPQPQPQPQLQPQPQPAQAGVAGDAERRGPRVWPAGALRYPRCYETGRAAGVLS